jgi:hypothetical protein
VRFNFVSALFIASHASPSPCCTFRCPVSILPPPPTPPTTELRTFPLFNPYFDWAIQRTAAPKQLNASYEFLMLAFGGSYLDGSTFFMESYSSFKSYPCLSDSFITVITAAEHNYTSSSIQCFSTENYIYIYIYTY